MEKLEEGYNKEVADEHEHGQGDEKASSSGTEGVVRTDHAQQTLDGSEGDKILPMWGISVKLIFGS